MNFTAMDITLRTLTENDLPFVKDIYDYYTLHTTVVYFVHCASIDELKNYIPVGDPVYRSFIIETPEGAPCGFCYFARFKPREAFRISVELTLYLKPEFTGRGYGKQAILRLEEIIRQEGFQQHNGTDFGRERSQHPPVRKMRFRMLRKHPAGSGEVRQKTGFEDVSENYLRQFTSHSLKADDKNTSTQEVLFKSESTIR
ncbi:GNAT family N-acetyltransferase [Bacteroides fragilis]|nr:GNAT family N-acetyltransferase [Bacteroides fragilis]